jgi:mannose-6-phosphate isomerase-like protein (cupin superfamily)
MTERLRTDRPHHPPIAPAFPGATGLTVLDVYDYPAPDGLHGGSAHVHLASTEGYLVLSGDGELQTLSMRGYAETPLRPGDCLWFTPGTIHRLVNHGDLRLAIVMQNAGLPEHGDAVLTFPEVTLSDYAAYAQAATLDAGDIEPIDAQARRRAWLAVKGYLALRDAVADKGPDALADFYAHATSLTSVLVPEWRDLWRSGPLAAAELTGEQLESFEAVPCQPGVTGHLTEGGLWRIPNPRSSAEGGATESSAAENSAARTGAAETEAEAESDTRAYGMCGRLTTYPAALASQVL